MMPNKNWNKWTIATWLFNEKFPKMAVDAMLELIPSVFLQLAACRHMCSAHSWAIRCRNVPACSPRSRMVLALLHLDKVLGCRREEVEWWWDPQESCTDSSWHCQPWKLSRSCDPATLDRLNSIWFSLHYHTKIIINLNQCPLNIRTSASDLWQVP